jgi:HEAT repeat protein
MPGKRIADIDRQAILAAIGRPGDGEIIDHLREGERDHDEIDARGAQAERADQQRRKPAHDDRDQPQHQHLVGAVDEER